VMISGMFLLPLFMQELLGFSAMQSGLALMPRTLVMLVAMPIVARIYARFPPWLLGAIGLFLNGYGQFRLSWLTLSSTSTDIIAAIMLQGVGMALMMVPLQTIALSTIPRHRMADATGLNSLIRQIASSMGLAAFATLLTRYGVFARDALRSHLVAERPEVLSRVASTEHGLMARGFDAVSAHGTALRALYGSIAREGTVIAFDKLFAAGAFLFLIVLPLILMLRTPKGLQPGERVTPAHVEME
jgi:DHA2 family multidrug resistance protein